MIAINNKSAHSFAIQQAYHQIKNDIVNRVFQPGQLLSTTFLSEHLKIESIFLQEVLCRLIYSGLITTNNDSTFNVIIITESMVRDMCTTMLQIEEIAITQSIAHGDHIWETEIHRTLQALDNAFNQPEHNDALLVERNQNFHNAIVANCNSPTLLQIRSCLYYKFNTLVQLVFKNAPSRAFLMQKKEEHRLIAQAVLNRDAKETCTLNYYHIIGSVKIIVDAINKNNK
ncbi:MAG: FCD domain-containing protein [Candidatus Babeliales bacterium]|nr:FCD domain-containing protein [Candidatus Babeliales bacterium]